MTSFEPNNRPNSDLALSDADLDEMLGVYALDAIDDERERTAVEDYLVRSPRARAEVDAHRQVASALGNAAVAAPDDLWSRISQSLPPLSVEPASGIESKPSIKSQRPRSRRSRAGLGFSPGQPSLVGHGGGVGSGGSIGGSRPWIAAAAAACVAIGAVGFGLSRHNELRTATAKNADLRSTVAVERARSSQLRSQLDQLARTSPVTLRLAELKRDPNVRDVQLLSTEGQPLGHVLLAPDGEGYILGDTLPMLAAGRTYQLWGVKDGLVLSLGVMGRSPKAMPFAADERWEQLVLTVEASPGVVASKAGASAVAKLDQA